ncbi:putative Cyclin [Trypanosoma vivax]|uniref:Putative CYC2-like cyclin n=1 Tax=Trypanosoma vivax (strain Y486) TaxID=1055687 RepID=G0TZG7_TRYVY|nr:putative Cyclin [Trypanosoma vivax]CCC49370.1 putative CYC2-like cyclin [Trypanosoma vivax Y486]
MSVAFFGEPGERSYAKRCSEGRGDITGFPDSNVTPTHAIASSLPCNSTSTDDKQYHLMDDASDLTVTQDIYHKTNGIGPEDVTPGESHSDPVVPVSEESGVATCSDGEPTFGALMSAAAGDTVVVKGTGGSSRENVDFPSESTAQKSGHFEAQSQTRGDEQVVGRSPENENTQSVSFSNSKDTCCNTEVERSRGVDGSVLGCVMKPSHIELDEEDVRLAMTVFLECLCEYNKDEPVLTSPFHSHRIPNVTVESYLQRIVKYGSLCGETLTVSLMLLIKYSYLVKHPVNFYNVHRLLITGALLAAKLRDDLFFSNEFFGRIGGIGLSEMNKLEVCFYEASEWDMWIDEEEYRKLAALLMRIASELRRNDNKVDKETLKGIQKRYWTELLQPWKASFEAATELRREHTKWCVAENWRYVASSSQLYFQETNPSSTLVQRVTKFPSSAFTRPSYPSQSETVGECRGDSSGFGILRRTERALHVGPSSMVASVTDPNGPAHSNGCKDKCCQDGGESYSQGYHSIYGHSVNSFSGSSQGIGVAVGTWGSVSYSGAYNAFGGGRCSYSHAGSSSRNSRHFCASPVGAELSANDALKTDPQKGFACGGLMPPIKPLVAHNCPPKRIKDASGQAARASAAASAASAGKTVGKKRGKPEHYQDYR